MARNYPIITLTIRDDQKAWLEQHPEINASGLFQKCIDEQMVKN